MSKLVQPEVFTVNAVIQEVQETTQENYFVLSIKDDATGESHIAGVHSKIMKDVKAGDLATVSLEKRISGVTGYKDSEGNVVLHKRTTLSVNSLIHVNQRHLTLNDMLTSNAGAFRSQAEAMAKALATI